MKKQMISSLIALAMIFTIIGPAMVSAAEPAQGTKSVTLHKLLMSAEDLKNWTQIEKYDGTQDVEGLKAIAEGRTIKEIAGVFFAVKKDGKWIDKNGSPLEDQTNLKDVLGGLTTGGGLKLDTSNLSAGTYTIEEISEKSTYVGEGGATLTDKKAVPVELILPFYNEKALVTDAHVYPKNTEGKPQIDKDFKGKANAAGPTLPKSTADHAVGDIIEYDIETIIPAKAKYGTAKWSDNMTEGLTFNATPFILTINGQEAVKEEDYKLSTTAKGFELSLTEKGLERINDKEEPVKVLISYTATLNDAAVSDVEETNDVVFNYGNNPDHGNAPIPTKPVNGEIKTNKTWADGTAPDGVTAKATLYNAQTGQVVKASDVAEDHQGTFINPVDLKADNNWSAVWKGLDNETEYKVVESGISGYSPEYILTGQGDIQIKNWKTNNPDPLSPEEPKVITGGEKFKKIDGSNGSALSGAEFIVKNNRVEDPDNGKFLALKDTTEQTQAIADYKAAEAAYQAAVRPATAENPDSENIASLKEKRDSAYQAMNMEWKWVGDQGEAFVFTSAQDGRFEVTGLAYGAYQLIETKPPTSYAENKTPIDFSIEKGTYSDDKIIDIKNNKVTIPQTGGMGTVIFIIAGLAIMGTAAAVMKRRNSMDI
ncbi:MAG: pilin N-terminal domain-containing protein [Gallicola sp.]|nr:pilin N-terminal domain-containing protein [Gallicola sp.]